MRGEVLVRLHLILLALCTAPLLVAAQNLKSPWDQSPKAVSTIAYPCGQAPVLPSTLVFNGYYKDKHHSIIDAKAYEHYERTSERLESFIKRITYSADVYRDSGDLNAATCAITMLAEAANQHAFARAHLGLNRARDGYYVQSFYLSGLSLAYLKVYRSPADSPEVRAKVDEWLLQIAFSVRKFYDQMAQEGAGDGRNNLIYWAGLGVAATGIATDRYDLFQWGVSTYRVGVGQIQPDGSLPLEMDRASMALHYHLFAAAPLVLLAELGEANGLDLYNEDHGAIHRLVVLATDGLLNASYFEAHAGSRQKIPKEIDGSVIGWAVPYQRRFPSPVIAELLKKSESTEYWMFGGEPPK